MSDVNQTPDERPRPTPRPRPGAAARPSPRPRVAGSRRDRDEPADEARGVRTAPVPRPRPAARASAAQASGRDTRGRTATAEAPRTARAGKGSASRPARDAGAPAARPGGLPRTAVALIVLCVLAAAATGFLVWQRLSPSSVDASVFSATRRNVQALYAFDYKNADRSVAGKLAVLSGSLRDQYAKDLKGGVIDTYKQVSATTSYDVVDVGLQQINNAQDVATLVVLGQYVVKSVNSGTQKPPQGSECQVTPDGAQSCTQTLRVQTTKLGGTWKITDVSVLTTS